MDPWFSPVLHFNPSPHFQVLFHPVSPYSIFVNPSLLLFFFNLPPPLVFMGCPEYFQIETVNLSCT